MEMTMLSVNRVFSLTPFISRGRYFFIPAFDAFSGFNIWGGVAMTKAGSTGTSGMPTGTVSSVHFSGSYIISIDNKCCVFTFTF
jgi:hypothetical protein